MSSLTNSSNAAINGHRPTRWKKRPSTARSDGSASEQEQGEGEENQFPSSSSARQNGSGNRHGNGNGIGISEKAKGKRRRIDPDEDGEGSDEEISAAAAGRRGGRGRAMDIDGNGNGDDDDMDLDINMPITNATSTRPTRNGTNGGGTGYSPQDRLSLSPSSQGPSHQPHRNGNGNTNGNGDATGSANEDDSDQEQTQGEEEEGEEIEAGERVVRRKRAEGESRRVALSRGSDGYVTGSILRIELSNFLTYKYVNFRPGPNLNLVIGPNGTGKSSIVCGIAIGLGFPVKVLGRAPNIKYFVRLGQSDAYTKIEIKGKEGRPNLVIKREFNKDTDKSVFYMNDEKTTGQKVTDAVQALGIQVNNMCSFLPQDKVASFAAMNAKELLKATMNAAGDANLTDWHETLVTTEKRVSRNDGELESSEDKLNRVSEIVNELEATVEASNERKRLEKELLLLKGRKLAKEHSDGTRIHKAAVAARRSAREAKARADAKVQPLRALKARISDIESKAKANHAKALSNYTEAQGKVRGGRTRMTQEADKAEVLTQEIEDLKGKEKRRGEAMTLLETRRDRAARSLKTADDNPPADPIPLEQKRRDINAQLLQLRQEDDASDNRIHDIQQAGRRIQQQLTMFRDRLKTLTDVETRRKALLARRDPSCGFAMNWIANNQGLFEKEICLPPSVSVQIDDARFAPLVESSLNRNQLHTFIAQTEKDYKTLNRLNDEPHYSQDGRRQRVRIATYQVTERDLQDLDKPRIIPPADLPQYGLNGYAIDFVQASDPVVAFLYSTRLHETALALGTADVARATAAGLRRFGHHEAGVAVGVEVKISRYGNKAPMTSTQKLHDGVYFKENIDQKEIDKAEAEIAQCVTEREQHELSVTANYKEKKTRDDTRKKLKDDMTKTSDQLAAIKAHIGKRKTDEREFENAKSEIERLKNEPSVREERQRLKVKMHALVKGRMKVVMATMGNYDAVNASIDDSAEQIMTVMQAQVDNNYIINADTTHGDAVKAAKRAVLEADAQIETAKEAVLKIGERFVAYKDLVTNNGHHAEEVATGVIQWVGEHPDVTVADLRQQADDIKNELTLQPDIDHAAEDRLRKEKGNQEELQEQVKKFRERKERYDKAITTTRDKFEPALDVLVNTMSDKFSTALDLAKVTGQVRIRRERTYADWAIEILVKFRDNEDLQVLTGQRQSGGERSLTTIMYLMSLMELSRSPFSLVDEINQGMDQRNERLVHNQLVRATCKPDAGQYFLITPKLLTGLDYDPRMRILVINNGDWLPDREQHFGRLAGLLSAYKARRNGAAGRVNGNGDA